VLWKGYVLRQAAYESHGKERIRTLEEALNVFDNALEINPRYAEAWAGKGVIYDDLAMFGKRLTGGI
jgi:Flp pilus assembly protein TadD